MRATLIIVSLVIVLMCGCVTRHGHLKDGRYFQDYDITFDPDKGFFEVPLEDLFVNESLPSPDAVSK